MDLKMASTSPFPLFAQAFRFRILPSLVAIYAPHPWRDGIVHQVGTGFLVRHNERPVVVTAAHTLLGGSSSEDPGRKSFHWNGKLHQIDAVDRTIVKSDKYDVAAFYADELTTKPQIREACITMPASPPSLITVGGYLARDFNRRGSFLLPAPMIHTDQRMTALSGADFTALRYTTRRSKNSISGFRIQAAPLPKGLSGGPLVSTFSLFSPEPIVVGLFTTLEYGQGFGPNAHVIRNLLAGI